MKQKYLIAAVLSAAISINSPAWASDSVVATYSGGTVKESDVMKKYSALSEQPQFKGKKFSELDPGLQDALVKNYIADILVTKEASDSKIQDSSAYKERLALVQERLPRDIFLEQIMTKSVSDKQINNEYNKLIEELKHKKRIKVSQIVVADEKTAKEVKSKIDKGVGFVEVCKQYSIDPNAKANTCSLGIINEGQLVAEFEKVAFSMKVGSISEPVQTQFGWHIIKLDEKLDAALPQKAEVIESIKDNMYKKALEQYMSNLFTKFDVRVTLPSPISKSKK
jgi:peptidyl-prolyl cis-trans isomerase C